MSSSGGSVGGGGSVDAAPALQKAAPPAPPPKPSKPIKPAKPGKSAAELSAISAEKEELLRKIAELTAKEDELMDANDDGSSVGGGELAQSTPVQSPAAPMGGGEPDHEVVAPVPAAAPVELEKPAEDAVLTFSKPSIPKRPARFSRTGGGGGATPKPPGPGGQSGSSSSRAVADAAASQLYPLAALQVTNEMLPPNVDTAKKEMFLEDAVFLELFGKPKAAWRDVPEWKKNNLKKQHGLF
jgi:hypothetical protein